MNEVLSTRPRIKWSMEERDEWIEIYRESGLTVDEFCRQNDFPKSKLTFWLESLEEGPAENALVEVPRIEPAAAAAVTPIRQPTVTPANPIAATQAPSPTSSAAVALQLPSGMRIEIPVGLDVTWFNGLLQSIVDAKV